MVRVRSVVLALALGVSALAASGSMVEASPTQGPSTTAVAFGGIDAATTTTAVAASSTEAVPVTSQEVTEGSSSESRLLTESRKLMATIGGLVVAALGLSLLTIRYWRATRPIDPDADAHEPVTGTEAALSASAAAAAPWPTGPAPAPEADGGSTTVVDTAEHEAIAHRRADEDYQPRGTGEHERIEVGGRSIRPGRAARAAALRRTAAG